MPAEWTGSGLRFMANPRDAGG